MAKSFSTRGYTCIGVGSLLVGKTFRASSHLIYPINKSQPFLTIGKPLFKPIVGI